ncbi:hypothetical protein P7H19_21775 [Paenibacillus larvae]|nr:hypothetical protein [Paenibacillus larvae]MDT2238383.1 hypothetical protein [Paenibacillus larvae]
MNLIDDYDKLEKAAKKFAKDYTLVGDVVLIQKTSGWKILLAHLGRYR